MERWLLPTLSTNSGVVFRRTVCLYNVHKLLLTDSSLDTLRSANTQNTLKSFPATMALLWEGPVR